jgi:SAM-dependent methyltransferase
MSYYDAEAFWQQTLRSRFDLTGVGHGGYGPRYNEFLYRAKVRAILCALERNQLSLLGKSVLDIGCGTGVFTALTGDLGCGRYVGADVAPVVIERLEATYPQHTFVQLDIGAPPEGQSDVDRLGRFDTVLCLDVMYHVVDPQRFSQALENVWSFLEPGGHLLLNDSFWRKDLIPGGTLEHRPGNVVPHVCFHRRLDYEKQLFLHDDFELLDMVPMYFLFNRPIVGAGFPWTNRRLSWHLRYRVFEAVPVLKGMLRLDGWLTRVPSNPSLKLMVARKART